MKAAGVVLLTLALLLLPGADTTFLDQWDPEDEQQDCPYAGDHSNSI